MTVKAVVFDLGNVLIKWRPEVAFRPHFDSDKAMHGAIEKIRFREWNALQDRGRDWGPAIAAGRGEHPEHGHLFQAYYDGLADVHREPIVGTVEILNELHAAGMPLYALTNASEETARVVRELHDFMASFKQVLVSGALGVLKPEREIFDHLARATGEAPEACVFIDDSPANVEGARNYGLQAVLFTDPDALRRELAALGLPV